MKNNFWILYSFLAFNLFFSLSSMEQTAGESAQLEDQTLTQAKIDSQIVLDTLQHQQSIMINKIKQLKEDPVKHNRSIMLFKLMKISNKRIVQQLQKALHQDNYPKVYSFFPDLYNAFVWFVDDRVKSKDTSSEVLDLLYKNIGKLALINIHKVSSEYDNEVKRPSKYKSDEEYAEALIEEFNYYNNRKE